MSLSEQVRKELADFEKPITIVESSNTGQVKYLKRETGGYTFSQKKMLDLIDLYDNSKFETGPKDSEGQRKLFLNVGTFRRKVASKQITLGIKDFIFIPDNYESIWSTWFMQRDFRVWSRENGYAELINELEENYPKYGTMVVKRVGKKLERVPLKNLINTQDAKSLKQAATTGGYVIEQHDFTKYELSQFKDWRTEGVKFEEGSKVRVYERYGLTCQDEIDEFNGKESEDETEVLSMAIVCLQEVDGKEYDHVLYVQKIREDEFPYEEEHWDKQDGRWLGIGEIENQLENQIAANTSVNLRRRAMLWSTKKIFQSTDEAVQRNLVKDVKDGTVLHIAPNGNVTPVEMGNRALADFNSDDALWEKNSNQKSFTFEVATGESLPSGTPFRLGVVLSDSVGTHFKRMKEKFGLFLIRAYFNQLIPIFKKQTKDHTISVLGSEEGAEHLREIMKRYYVWEEFKSLLLKGQVPNREELEAKADAMLAKEKYHFVEVLKNCYDNAKFRMELEVTGQAIDTRAEIESLTTIFTSLASNPALLQNPQMLRMLELIVSKTGRTLKDFLGETRQQLPAQGVQQLMQPNAPQGTGGALPQALA